MAILDNLLTCLELDETSGTTAQDAHTTNSDGTTTGATVNQTGIINKAYDFDGTDDFVDIDNNTIMDGLGAFSVSQWVKTDTTAGELASFGSDQQIRLSFNGATPRKFKGDIDVNETTRQTVTGTTTVVTGTWYHLVMTYDGTDQKLYVDGGLEDTNNNTSLTLKNASQIITIGGWGFGSSVILDWDGLVDQTAIWDRAITAAEVTTIYNSGSGLAYPFTIATTDNPPMFGANF